MDKQNILNTLRHHKAELEHFGIRRIGLFGSYVRNEAAYESDIDLVIEFKNGKKSFDNLMNLKFYLEEELFHGKKVDLVIVENIKTALRSEILHEVVYAS